MHIYQRHDWNLKPPEAVALQKQLVGELITNRPIVIDKLRLVAGVDVSVKNEVSHAAVVVVSFPDLQPVETVTATQPTPFPYIPGLLSFREGPVLAEAFAQLQHEPDVFIFDGMGIAHPRRIGIAAHMGLWLQKPTVGCGKTLLTGNFVEPGLEKGSYSDLIDRKELIGAVVRTRTGVNPVFISPGHLADLPTSIELILRCTVKYRLPEPIRMAHNAAGDF
ncbi:MAG TPA: deoxyribonuclease V [Phototrophicaceae bacterium]|nr:deoxyribonuclease V [Phototrophicaceae bacterium]